MDDLTKDAEDAVRLVRGVLRRGETGEAFRERRRVVSWTVNEAGLLSSSVTEECGTAVRVRRGREALLVARDGDGPEALKAAIREVARRNGSSPFFKPARSGEPRHDEPLTPEDERFASLLAAAVAQAVPDPRGLSLLLVASRVSVARAVVTSRAATSCGAIERIEVEGSIERPEAARSFSFLSCRSLGAALETFAQALRDAVRPVPPLAPTAGLADVVFTGPAAGVFWHEAVGHPLEAGGPEGGSVLARVPGAAVAPRGVHVVDDPTRSDLPGGYLVDDEGVPSRPVALLADGLVGETLTDRRSAGAASNGHGRSSDFRRSPRVRIGNLVVGAGRLQLDELITRCATGLLVREVSSGAADPESGRFVLSVERADLIRRGRLGAPVAPFTVSGDILSALSSLEPELGDTAVPAGGLGLCLKGGDPVPVGGSSPAILIRGLTVRTGGR